MTHTPAHCPKCIINGGFVAPAADLYHQLTLSDAAERLAAVATAASETFKHAIEIGALPAPEVDNWKGCDEAAEIMSWVGKQFGHSSGESRGVREEKMNEWARTFAAVAHGVVSGEPHQHEHAGHAEHAHADDSTGNLTDEPPEDLT